MGKFADDLQARLRQGSENAMLIGAKSCRSCEHRLLKGALVFCRRYPPQTFVIVQPSPNGPVTTPMSWYPPVNPDEPCGEYARNKTYADDELRAAAPESRQ